MASPACDRCREPLVGSDPVAGCVECRGRFHQACLDEETAACPRCLSDSIFINDPTADDFYVPECPGCEARVERNAECPSCGAPTRWDSREEYLEWYATTIGSLSWWERLSAYVPIALGVVALVTTFLYATQSTEGGVSRGLGRGIAGLILLSTGLALHQRNRKQEAMRVGGA